MALITRSIAAQVSRIQARTFTQTAVASSFITDLFADRKTLLQRNEGIAEKQTAEASAAEEEGTKIVFLNKKNSEKYKAFNAAKDMPNFEVAGWKNTVVQTKDIEKTYLKESLREIIVKSLNELERPVQADAELSSITLEDLQFRFQLAKKIQQNLGFDISDYIFSQSHDVQTLYTKIAEVIAARWTNERNPNAIVLRLEDFSAGNIYLNEELTEREQEKLYKKLLAQAQGA